METNTCNEFDWLLHLHYVRGEFDRVNTLASAMGSDYAFYVRGLVRLRDKGDVRGALRSFSSIRNSHEATYDKATARCLTLLGQHLDVTQRMRNASNGSQGVDWQVWQLLGCSLLHLFEFSNAKDAFQRALQTSNQIEPFLALAHCHLIEADVKSTIFVLRRAVELCPDNSQLTAWLGLLLYQNGQRAKGVEKLLSLGNGANNSDLALNLALGAVLQEARNDADSALYRYRLAACADSAALWNNVALCLAGKNRLVAAVCCLKRSVYLAPLRWSSHYNIALLCLQLRQFASAFIHLKCAAALTNASQPLVLSLLAITLEQLQDENNAAAAHKLACTSALNTTTPLPLLNHAAYLLHKHASDSLEDGSLLRLLQQFEQCWIKKNKQSGEFDALMMSSATKLANLLRVQNQMAWLKQSGQITSTANSEQTT